ncbi:hypothetical protein [Clostridium sp.]|nr:hypothetical protein [Clostridium sp.]
MAPGRCLSSVSQFAEGPGQSLLQPCPGGTGMTVMLLWGRAGGSGKEGK